MVSFAVGGEAEFCHNLSIGQKENRKLVLNHDRIGNDVVKRLSAAGESGGDKSTKCDERGEELSEMTGAGLCE